MSTNTLGVYNPLFYANEALIALHKALGMAGRVHRGYDEERKSFERGQTISIKRPSTFVVQDAPSTAQDLNTGFVNLSLDYWKEVKFKLTDRELTFTGEKIIADHIVPAAYALADDVDQKLCALYKDVPWHVDLQSTTAVRDITDVQENLFNRGAMMPTDMHYMINGSFQNSLLQLSAFSQASGAGNQGVATQMRGSLGEKFGFEMFGNQNVPTHTPGVSADAVGALTADAAKGAISIAIDSVTSGGTFKAGDTLVIAGNTQRYAITADVTATGGAATLSITPPLVAAASTGAVVTIRLDSHVANLAFHRNAFALAMAPLSDMAKELGARVATITDPITGLSIRSRLYYVGNSSEVHCALDILYGVKTLDPNLACRACG